MSAEVLDSSFSLPIGKAKVCALTVKPFCTSHLNPSNFFFLFYIFLSQIEREGKDVTITAFSKMVGYALQVCESFVIN